MLLTMDKYKLSLIQEKHRRCRIAVPLVWSPAWYARQTVVRQAPRQIGKQLLRANVIDEVGEYLIFSGTEEWSRLLFSIGEAPSE